MRYSCRASVEYDLKMHYKIHEKYIDEIQARAMYKDVRLKIANSSKGRNYYGVKVPGSSKYDYRGLPVDDDSLLTMEYKYFKKALEVIEENIVAMENFLRVYKNTKAEHINELLKKTYSIPRKRLMMLDDREAEEWLDQKRKEKSKYPVFDEAGLTVTAFDGTLVRSRAEALQYEAYYIYNLPVIFEYPYKIGNELYRPDFLSLDVYLRRDVISEHLGNWFHENDHKRNKYRNESIHRIDEYTKIGFYPEDNLMLTFGTNDRVFNVQSIHRKVALMAFPPPDKDTIEMLRRA